MNFKSNFDDNEKKLERVAYILKRDIFREYIKNEMSEEQARQFVEFYLSNH